MEISTYTKQRLDVFTIIHNAVAPDGDFIKCRNNIFSIDNKHITLKKIRYDINYIITNKGFHIENPYIRKDDERQVITTQLVGVCKNYKINNGLVHVIDNCNIPPTSIILSRLYEMKPIPLLIMAFQVKMIATLEVDGIEKIKSHTVSIGEDIYKIITSQVEKEKETT
jgi:hypothetical protein